MKKNILCQFTALFLCAVLFINYSIPIIAKETSLNLSIYTNNEVLIKYKEDSNTKHLLSTLSLDDSLSIIPINDDFALLGTESKEDLKTILPILKQNKNIEYIQPNYTYQITSSAVSEPDFPKQWGLHNDGTFSYNGIASVNDIDINAKEAWEVFENGRETIVAVIDTGIDYTHPDLIYSMWVNDKEIDGDGIDNDNNGFIDDIHGWNFYNDNNVLYTIDSNEDNHGTHCAGTIAASANGIGIAGIGSNTNIKIMCLKALGGEDGTGTTASVINAISYAESMGASICNLSCGMTEVRDNALGDAIKNSSMLFVSAAGNGNSLTMSYNNDKKPTYPASFEYDNIISVANIRCNGTLHILSNYGLESVDIAAPGTGIYSTQVGGGYKYLSGTSMSAPMVTGVAALVYSRFKQITPKQVREVLLNTARPLDSLTNKVATGGIVDAYAAVTEDVVTLLSLDVTPPKIKTRIAPITNSYKKKLKIHITDNNNILTAAYAKGKKNSSYFNNGKVGKSLSLNKSGNASLTISSSGTYTIYAIDSVGNERLTTVTIKITIPRK